MAKKTQPRKDAKETRRLRPVAQDELKSVIGGDYIPGQYKTSSGGGTNN